MPALLIFLGVLGILSSMPNQQIRMRVHLSITRYLFPYTDILSRIIEPALTVRLGVRPDSRTILAHCGFVGADIMIIRGGNEINLIIRVFRETTSPTIPIKVAFPMKT